MKNSLLIKDETCRTLAQGCQKTCLFYFSSGFVLKCADVESPAVLLP